MMRLKRELLDAIKKQGLNELPDEACGYLIGKDLESLDENILMENVDHSPEHFSFAPADQFKALKTARSRNKSLLAVYHTHPETPARMSEEDKLLANDPNMVYLIYSLSDDVLKAFRINRDKEVNEVEFEFY